MPKRRRQNAMTRMRTAWTKRERRKLMAASLEGQQERHEIRVLLGRQHLPERLRHDARREAGDGARAFRVEDLLHDVVRRLDLGDLRKIRTDRRGADLARFVARDAAALTLKHGLTRF